MTVAKLKPVSVAQLRPSEDNPRQDFDQTQLAELAASIETHGVLQPLVVRELDDGQLEIIAGERRFRAAQQLQLKTVPALVHPRGVSDGTARLWRLVENLQRKDLHPLEEADGYAAALRPGLNLSVDELARQIGKSKAHVWARLKLADAGKELRAAILKGTLSASAALPLARIGPKEQGEAVKQLLKDRKFDLEDGAAISARDAEDFVQQQWCRQLKGAAFQHNMAYANVTRPDGVHGGTCLDCPFRTGNLGEGQGKKRGDVCTRVSCFRAKVQAEFDRQADKAKAAGGKAEEIKTPYGYGGRLVPLDDRVTGDPKYRTWGKLLGKERPPVTVVKRGEEIERCVDEAEARKVLARKHSWAKGRRSSARSFKASAAERKARRAVAVAKALLPDICKKAASAVSGDPKPALRHCVEHGDWSAEACLRVAERRGWKKTGGYRSLMSRFHVEPSLSSMSEVSLWELLFELSIAAHPFETGKWNPAFASAAKLAKVDLAKALRTKARPKKAPKGKPAKAPRRR